MCVHTTYVCICVCVCIYIYIYMKQVGEIVIPSTTSRMNETLGLFSPTYFLYSVLSTVEIIMHIRSMLLCYPT